MTTENETQDGDAVQATAVERGVDQETAGELLEGMGDDTLLVYPLGPAPAYAYPKKDYIMLVRDRGGHYTQSSTTEERVFEHLQDAFWTENFGTEPQLMDIDDAPETVQEAAR